MGYKTILVHINNERRLTGLIEAATAMATEIIENLSCMMTSFWMTVCLLGQYPTS